MVSNLLMETDEVADASSAVLRPSMRNGNCERHSESVTMFKPICEQLPRCKKENLEPVIELAVEIAREEREGRRGKSDDDRQQDLSVRQPKA
jgi:hypothetical protein